MNIIFTCEINNFIIFTVVVSHQTCNILPQSIKDNIVIYIQIPVRALGNAIDVPVWVERQTVDLKICLFDRLYQDTILVKNRY